MYYNDKGVLHAKKVYSENHIDATVEMYSEHGNVIATGFYKNKKRDGEWLYYSENQGAVILLETYSNGVLDGLCVSYYETGVPQFEGRYKNGTKVGEWKTYSPEGDVVSVDSYDEGKVNAPELESVDLGGF